MEHDQKSSERDFYAKHDPYGLNGLQIPLSSLLDDGMEEMSPVTSTASTPPLPSQALPSAPGASNAQDPYSSKTASPRPPSATVAHQAKRKRSRVNPDQLTQLERIFAVDRSPTAARRKEISELLGMQERQTQIWFQNRRAKAKLQESKGRHVYHHGDSPRHGLADLSGVTPPDTPPGLVAGFEGDLQALLHEVEPVSIIPCTDLSIGTWRRIASTTGRHDLVAYNCESKRSLTWFIHSAGFGFKMEIPYDIIKDIHFDPMHSGPQGQGRASFILAQPPHFYMEDTLPPATKVWKRCSDWTQGMQATAVLRHDVVGSAIQLAHTVRGLEGAAALASGVGVGANIQLHPPGYALNMLRSPSLDGPLPVQIQPPPMMGLPVSQPYAFPNPAVQNLRPMHAMHGRKRSFSGPAAFDSSALLPDLASHHSQSQQGSEGGAPQQRYTPNRANSLQFLSSLSSYQNQSQQHHMSPPPSALLPPQQQQQQQQSQSQSHSSPLMEEYSSVPISHAVAQRPYTANGGLTSRSFGSGSNGNSSNGAGGGGEERMSHPQRRYSELTSGSGASSALSSLSQPLLTTPFTPNGGVSVSGGASSSSSSSHGIGSVSDVMSSLPPSVFDELEMDMSAYPYLDDESSAGGLGVGVGVGSLESAMSESLQRQLEQQHPSLG
ncbi:hypothetical protein BOTBODRAFT_273374 [Botryobasidium botryosum FD-172 SS1]|uniref:Homeobox domain-containing protein n=1 Tax=Botryobasidium botryosum (strain FD-172 SS1) TaxID=930990 RepID=A0A067MJX4_BOTB1|nr:hypothetical protein BOTBODRAFT_273374 [Botryobasidium botryosum FD-172 SS1]